MKKPSKKKSAGWTITKGLSITKLEKGQKSMPRLQVSSKRGEKKERLLLGQ